MNYKIASVLALVLLIHAPKSSASKQQVHTQPAPWEEMITYPIDALNNTLTAHFALIRSNEKTSGMAEFYSQQAGIDEAICDLEVAQVTVPYAPHIQKQQELRQERSRQLARRGATPKGWPAPEHTTEQLRDMQHERMVLQMKYERTQKYFWQTKFQELQAKHLDLLHDLQPAATQQAASASSK